MKKILLGVALLAIVIYALSSHNISTPTTTSAQPAATASTPASNYQLQGPPTIRANFIDQVLAHYHSPAAGTGQAMYDLGKQAGIDPVFALAFFMHESLFGTTGEARVTLSLGNERCIPDRPCIDQSRGGYARMQSWMDGYAKWYKLIQAYISGEIEREIIGYSKPLITVAQIIPVYAPSTDHNDERAYIQAIEHAVATWRAGQIVVK